jgi:hypothetical protein
MVGGFGTAAAKAFLEHVEKTGLKSKLVEVQLEWATNIIEHATGNILEYWAREVRTKD